MSTHLLFPLLCQKRPQIMRRTFSKKHSGIILLVVLSMLTFFSLLTAAYLVFSSEARNASYGISTRNIKKPDPNSYLNESLLTLLRGTSDVNDPFFGEDLLSDFYGRTDSLRIRVYNVSAFTMPAPSASELPTQFGNGFVRLPVQRDVAGAVRLDPKTNDGLFSGRVITFRNGPLANKSFRVVDSSNVPAGPPAVLPAHEQLVIDLSPLDISNLTSPAEVLSLFYRNSTSTPPTDPYSIHMNGSPRNGRGIGYNAPTNLVSRTAPTGGLGYSLPAALQPNSLPFLPAVPKTVSPSTGEDFDEGYDAADFNNWFMSYRHTDGRVIPSFHRPAVINYILNETPDWSSANLTDFRNVTASLLRATFRPIPIDRTQFGALNTVGIHEKFTGGNENFAIRSPLPIANAARLHQLAKVLTGSVDNPWDVDNDGDGVGDSIWMNVGLPEFLSPEGKLIRPLVAPMIEDLSSRLNLNAHHNLSLSSPPVVGLNSAAADWAGTTDVLNATANQRDVFRGLGYGPAEIGMPYNDLVTLVRERYQSPSGGFVTTPLPGTDAADAVDTLRTGWRPGTHTGTGGYGMSMDPFGRGGVAIGRSGQLVSAASGIQVFSDNLGTVSNNETTDAALNDPYESDPTGHLRGDSMFSHDEVEAMLRGDDFDVDLLPQEIRRRLLALINTNPNIKRLLTTTSVSDDTPPSLVNASTAYDSLLTLFESIDTTTTMPPAVQQALVPHELRRGRKLDVNRRIGNGIDEPGRPGLDDNSDGTADDPAEFNGVIDEPAEVAVENEAFAVAPSSGQVVPAGYAGVVPSYNFGLGGVIDGRELLAKDLYVLIMALTHDYSFPVTGIDPIAYRARRIAQWAVNVVDYRDPDSIMTRFVFDQTPFDSAGWNPPVAPTAANIVWGVESPELVFTEGTAFHDVRVRDTEFDNDGQADKADAMNADNDTDQVRMPQGSMLLELLAPRSQINGDGQTKPGLPREFYDVAGQLNLGATAPPVTPGTAGAPVWRIAFSQPHFDGSAFWQAASTFMPPYGNEGEDPESTRTSLVETASFDPTQQDELGSTSLTLERFICFTNFNTFADVTSVITDNMITDMAAHQVFFAPDTVNAGGRNLLPGQYLTLASNTTTFLGSYATAGTPERPSTQRFVVTPAEGVIHFDVANMRRTPVFGPTASYMPAFPLVIKTFPPSGGGWNATNLPDGMVGLNISEPLPRGTAGYYPLPIERYMGTAGPGVNYPLTDAYVDLTVGGNTAPDVPLDIDTVRNFGRIPPALVPAPPTGAGATGPTVEPVLGTIPRYCSAFLQRLADPTAPYDAITNPYRTIDWMSMDLTVFSGEEEENRVVSNSDYGQRSRQRNGFVDGVQANALYSYDTDALVSGADIVTTDPDYFSFNGADKSYQSSFNFLNTVDATSNPGFVGFAASIGSLPGAMNITNNDRNFPQTPFALHPWLNRPFATPYELLLVPACSQGRLFEEFTTVPSGTDPVNYPTDPLDVPQFRGPFRHLLNFFHNNRNPSEAAQFSRILDFAHTLPPFSGEVEVVLPSRVSGTILDPLMVAPFNLLYDNRRQGRVNLNTIAEFDVWRGLMQGHLNAAEYTTMSGLVGTADQLSFDKFLESRRGYTTTSTPAVDVRTSSSSSPVNYSPLHFDPLYPTEFAGVFRDSVSTPLMPALRDTTATTKIRRRPINGTLMRGNGDLNSNDPDFATPQTAAQFVRVSTQSPTFGSGSGAQINRNNNPFLRYQALMRMPNLSSDNSQSFVVRLTLGFFEVDPTDTRSLGAEYREAVGQNERYQALFIVDRSIPVGFVPGEDLNVRDTVVFERFYQ